MKNKILLIDDDPALMSLLSQYLRESEFVVLEASNGPAGLRLAFSEKPDLILLDVMLPGMDGWEVCSRLRELTDLPIIMVTAKTTEADKLRGFHLGVDDYVTKPFSFSELVARIQAIIGRMNNENTKNKFIAHGEILLDLGKFQASLNGKDLDLTPTEFHLLEVLVNHKGMVISDEKLMHEVWDTKRNDAALVRRYISILRKKLETNPSNPKYILTMRGFGYYLSNPRTE